MTQKPIPSTDAKNNTQNAARPAMHNGAQQPAKPWGHTSEQPTGQTAGDATEQGEHQDTGKGTGQSTEQGTATPSGGAARTGTRGADFWYDRQHRDLLFYLSIAIFLLELIVGAVAFFYGVMHALPDPNGGPPRFQFPWLAYALAAVLAPAALLLIVHFAGVGLFRSLRGQEDDGRWQKDLPERLRKIYAIIQGAPTVVLLVGIMLLGVALFYLDGAVEALKAFTTAAGPYLPWIAGGLIGAWCVAYVARIWLDFRTRKLEAEYQFRREVLERTGIVIVEQGGMRLPEATTQALEAADAPKMLDINPAAPLPPNTIANEQKGSAAKSSATGEDADANASNGPVLDVTPEPPVEVEVEVEAEAPGEKAAASLIGKSCEKAAASTKKR